MLEKNVERKRIIIAVDIYFQSDNENGTEKIEQCLTFL